MRVAVLSDVHANLRALQAALSDIDACGVEEIWCLGDLVGRGAEPAECVALVAERASVVLSGNHDRIVCGQEPLERIGWHENLSSWTASQLSDAQLSWLGGLSPVGHRNGIGLVHASPRDPVWEHIDGRNTAENCLYLLGDEVCLFGHTHQPADWRLDAHGRAFRGEQGPISGPALVNPGAISGKARGGGIARWMILELSLDGPRYELRSSSYDIGGFIASMRASRFSEGLVREIAGI